MRDEHLDIYHQQERRQDAPLTPGGLDEDKVQPLSLDFGKAEKVETIWALPPCFNELDIILLNGCNYPSILSTCTVYVQPRSPSAFLHPVYIRMTKSCNLDCFLCLVYIS